MVNLVFASDHAGVELKTILIRALSESNYSVKDLDLMEIKRRLSDYAHPLAQSLIPVFGPWDIDMW